jgi:hypothetical protein
MVDSARVTRRQRTSQSIMNQAPAARTRSSPIVDSAAGLRLLLLNARSGRVKGRAARVE